MFLFGLFFGTLCLFMLVGTLRAGRRAYACGPRATHAWGPHHHHGGGRDRFGRSDRRDRHDRGDRRDGRRDWRRRDPSVWAARFLRSRLDLDGDQEEEMEASLRGSWKAMRTFFDIVGESSDELADAVKGDELDKARLDAVFEKWDESLAEARADIVRELRRAHAGLDPEQRERLAELIASNGPKFV